MAEIKVTYAKLKETADTISTSTKEFQGVMQEVSSIMESLRGKWESDAAEKFHVQFSKLNTNFTTYEKTLNQYSAYLYKTADEYLSVDSKVSEETNVLDGSALFS